MGPFNFEKSAYLVIGEAQPEFFQEQQLKPQMTQIAQMGADSTRVGPPQAASGPAGGQRGRRGRAFWVARAPAPPLKPMLKTIDSRF